MSPIRILRAVAASVALVAAVVAATAAPAQAQQPDAHLNCLIDFFATIDPPFGLAATPQSFDVEATGSLNECVPVTPDAEGLESATLEASGTGTATACVVATSTGTGEIHWNDNTTSEFSYQANLDPTSLAQGVWIVLTVTDGRLAGSVVVPVGIPVATGTCFVTPLSGVGLAAGAAPFTEL